MSNFVDCSRASQFDPIAIMSFVMFKGVFEGKDFSLSRFRLVQ